MSVHMSVRMSVHRSAHISIHLLIHMSGHIIIRMPAHMCTHISTHHEGYTHMPVQPDDLDGPGPQLKCQGEGPDRSCTTFEVG